MDIIGRSFDPLSVNCTELWNTHTDKRDSTSVRLNQDTVGHVVVLMCTQHATQVYVHNLMQKNNVNDLISKLDDIIVFRNRN